MELLELHNITKRYPGVTALDNVSISFREGEVHALVGENGAGKSTFIKTISGAVQPNEGEIVFDGVTYPHLTPQKSLELGISVVYQEMIQFEAMSVADNLFMSDGSDGGLFVNDAERNKKAAELLQKFQCHVSPKTWVRELSMANRQIVEICKAILRKARVLILDEPTASITVEEQRRLFDALGKLPRQGQQAHRRGGAAGGEPLRQRGQKHQLPAPQGRDSGLCGSGRRGPHRADAPDLRRGRD